MQPENVSRIVPAHELNMEKAKEAALKSKEPEIDFDQYQKAVKGAIARWGEDPEITSTEGF